MSAETPSPQAAPLRVVVVGHVDHGKSTLIGRLLHDTGSLAEGQLEQLKQAAERRGTPFEWANLMDALQAERDQNVTIDTTQIWFRTAQRPYVLIDAPGHKEFLKNMITGAASADAALLVIDAQEGVQENSRRHGYLLHLLGIRQVAVVVNKMDLVAYSEKLFRQVEQEYREFLRALGVEAAAFIPVAARHGDNLASRGTNLAWWTGPTVVEALDKFSPLPPAPGRPLRFVVQDVYRFDERRIVAGRVESGTLRVGDRLLFSPGQKTSVVKSIERWNAPSLDYAEAGESIGITLVEQVFIERGALASLETEPPYALSRFKARVFWLGREPFRKGRAYKLKLGTQEVECEIEALERVIDAGTLETQPRPGPQAGVQRHEVADVRLRTRRPVAFDAYSEIAATGRFVLCDGLDVAGGGVVLDDHYPRRTADSLHKSTNIFWSTGEVTPQQRAQRNGHPGCIVWLTGLSGAGKSTIAVELERELFNLGLHAYVLDGDKVRHGLCKDLAFSPTDRRENIRRVGEVAKLFADAGVICVTAFISPYRADRELVRQMMQPGDFIEVYVNAPLAVCEQRDPKGLYAKARANQIKEFTGISAPYEAPESPEVEIHTDQLAKEESVALLLGHLKATVFARVQTA